MFLLGIIVSLPNLYIWVKPFFGANCNKTNPMIDLGDDDHSELLLDLRPVRDLPNCESRRSVVGVLVGDTPQVQGDRAAFVQQLAMFF